jgi:hypothetical protein
VDRLGSHTSLPADSRSFGAMVVVLQTQYNTALSVTRQPTRDTIMTYRVSPRNTPSVAHNITTGSIVLVYLYLMYIKMEPKMYNNSSIENGWADLVQIFFLIVRNCREKVFTENIFV